MPDQTPDAILAQAQLPPINGRPVRKDEIELHDRGLYIESWLPERRSRRKPLLFVHGELGGSWAWERFLGYFAGRGWEGHALNLRNHHWSQTADPARAVVRDLRRRRRSPRWSGSARRPSSIGHGMGGLLALKAAERMPISGLVAHRRRSCRATSATAGPRRTRSARSPSCSAGRCSAGRRCPRSFSATIAT